MERAARSSVRRSVCGGRWVLAIACAAGCAVDQRTFEVVSSTSDASIPSPGIRASDAGVDPSPPDEPLAAPGDFAVSGMVRATPSDVDLGARPIDDPTPVIEWTFTNGGTEALRGMQLSGEALPLFQYSNGCGTELAPGGSCVVAVVYVPRLPGEQAAGITMSWVGGELRLIVRARGLPWLSVVVEGDGRVTSTPPGIDCPGTCRAPFDVELEVTLEASRDTGARVAGWRGPGCSGEPVPSCAVSPVFNEQVKERTVEVGLFRPTNNLVFITSEQFSVALGGTAPYDAACNRLATAAGINNAAGTGYIAALSDSNSFFWDRLSPGVQGWQRMDGQPYADTITDVLERGVVYHSIAFDETGLFQDERRPTLSGLASDGALGEHCSNWTVTQDASFNFDYPAIEGPGSLLGGFTIDCGAAPTYNVALTCLGNTSTTPLQRQASVGKRIWVTNTPVVLGTMTPDEACQALRPSGVAQAVAFVAYTNRAAVSILDPRASYVRPDGTLVGTGAEIVDALRNQPVRPTFLDIWQRADGTYIFPSNYVWTGADRIDDRGTPESTCNDWTTTTGNGGLWLPIAKTGYGQFAAIDEESCALLQHFYCIEP